MISFFRKICPFLILIFFISFKMIANTNYNLFRENDDIVPGNMKNKVVWDWHSHWCAFFLETMINLWTSLALYYLVRLPHWDSSYLLLLFYYPLCKLWIWFYLQSSQYINRAVFFSWLPVNHGRVSQISCEIYNIYGQFHPWKMSN